MSVYVASMMRLSSKQASECSCALTMLCIHTLVVGFVSPYESTATAKLLEEGAIPLGKLNMDEFAMGSGTLYTKFGATINPWSTDLGDAAVVAGGSSGGSAAAVASGCCFAALGSDTGGSVRQVRWSTRGSLLDHAFDQHSR